MGKGNGERGDGKGRQIQITQNPRGLFKELDHKALFLLRVLSIVTRCQELALDSLSGIVTCVCVSVCVHVSS